jgi:hypothetical protein
MWEALVRVLEHLSSAKNPLWFYYPLCAVVAVVYKATKFDDPKKIALSALHFFVTVSLGMLALAVVLTILSVWF